MLFHMRKNAVDILEKFHMAVLIHLIITDRLGIQAFFDCLDIVIACRKGGNTCAGERDL